MEIVGKIGRPNLAFNTWHARRVGQTSLSLSLSLFTLLTYFFHDFLALGNKIRRRTNLWRPKLDPTSKLMMKYKSKEKRDRKKDRLQSLVRLEGREDHPLFVDISLDFLQLQQSFIWKGEPTPTLWQIIPRKLTLLILFSAILWENIQSTWDTDRPSHTEPRWVILNTSRRNTSLISPFFCCTWRFSTSLEQRQRILRTPPFRYWSSKRLSPLVFSQERLRTTFPSAVRLSQLSQLMESFPAKTRTGIRNNFNLFLSEIHSGY